MTAPAPSPTHLPPDGQGGRYYWDGRAWSPRPRKQFRPNLGIVIVLGVFALIFVGYYIFGASGGFKSDSTSSSAFAIPSTSATTPSSGTLSCKQTDITGASYYVQVVFSDDPGNICSAGQQRYTREELQAIPGLTLQCTYDLAGGPVARSHGTVSIYSDGSDSSTAAAKLVCTINGR